MSESMRMWVEISFNCLYLITIWGLVITMFIRRDSVRTADRRAANLVMLAFALLALGDTGHVGFRVLAYALGDLEASLQIFGNPVGLVGAGAFSTAFTVTLFYMLVVELWRERFDQHYSAFPVFLLIAGVVRMVVMLLPGNNWNQVVPPQPMSLIRNLPLVIQGLGVAYLILRDARRQGDRIFGWIGGMILVSYACYLPVILFVQQFPVIGMLMIPKTMAYVAIGFLAYRELYNNLPAAIAEGSKLSSPVTRP